MSVSVADGAGVEGSTTSPESAVRRPGGRLPEVTMSGAHSAPSAVRSEMAVERKSLATTAMAHAARGGNDTEAPSFEQAAKVQAMTNAWAFMAPSGAAPAWW